MGWKPGKYLKRGLGHLTGSLDRTDNRWGQVDPSGNLGRESGSASGFASGSERRFRSHGRQLEGVADRLRAQAEGRESLSAEQLRQGLAQSVASQQAAAAGASPANAAMASRTAMGNIARLGSGASGQKAMAGIAERAAANQALGNLYSGMRQQDLQAALGSRGQALSGYGGLEQARTSRFAAAAGAPTSTEHLMGMGMGAGSMDMMASDRTMKTNIQPGDDDAQKFLDALKPHTYRYKSTGDDGAMFKHLVDRRPGKRFGIMAQDLEKSPMGAKAVINTPAGKAISIPELATQNAAASGQINDRLKRVEDAVSGSPMIQALSGRYKDEDEKKPEPDPRMAALIQALAGRYGQ